MAEIPSHEELVAYFREINENLTKEWGLWMKYLEMQERITALEKKNAELRTKDEQ